MPRQAVLSQEEKQARTLERDRLKKRRQREDGLKRSLERQRNALAMKLQREDGWEWEKERVKERKAKRRRWASVEEPEDREAERRQRQKREEQARALQWKMATLVQRWEKDRRQEGRPVGEASACRPAANPTGPIWGTGNSQVPQSKYAELLAIIEELGKEIRPTYAGSKSAMERLKRGIIHARGLVRECLAETERNARS
nr:cyclin-dependent kinase 2-associated protein 1 isoform X1 [Dasypus novemcinctus]